jgi:hypothetical protein
MVGPGHRADNPPAVGVTAAGTGVSRDVGTAATSEAQLHEWLAGFAAAGADEVMVLPCAADPAQLERLAAVALRRPALV